MSIDPIAKVVATLEPETAAKIMQVRMQVQARPPCTPPTTDFGEFHESGRNAALAHEVAGENEERNRRERKFVERRESLLGHERQRKIRERRHPRMLASPIEMATGIESASSTHIPMSIVAAIARPRPYRAVSSSWRRGSKW
jgi:hypothetical protein